MLLVNHSGPPEASVRNLLLEAARTGATSLLGLFAGGLVFTVLAPSLLTLPALAYVRHWQALNTDYGRAMPVLLLTCLALLLVTCATSYQRGRPVFWLTVTAALLLIAVIVLTLTALDPLNRLADSWNADRPPADWTDIRRHWWTLHTIRTAMAVLAFLSLLIANVADRTKDEPPGAPSAGRLQGSGSAAGAGR
ncbi:anthrone oxygenase family protein [Streptosporangium canum]|uniref:anthrone oxygenase family protein n=1 Tax=Streptosporangium canum TaxID=324952 RepID=UPI0037B8BEEB